MHIYAYLITKSRAAPPVTRLPSHQFLTKIMASILIFQGEPDELRPEFWFSCRWRELYKCFCILCISLHIYAFVIHIYAYLCSVPCHPSLHKGCGLRPPPQRGAGSLWPPVPLCGGLAGREHSKHILKYVI